MSSTFLNIAYVTNWRREMSGLLIVVSMSSELYSVITLARLQVFVRKTDKENT